MKLQYMCLDSVMDLWPPGHFELGFSASRLGRPEMECAAFGLDNSLKWILFNIVSGQITSDTLWK